MAKLSARKRESMTARIAAYDMCAILDDSNSGDLSYLLSWLYGEGLTQYNKMSDNELCQEWREGKYGGPSKREIVTSSQAYKDHEYIRQLWDKGVIDCVSDGRKTHCIGSPEFKRLMK